ncbi:MAG TPA: hypothetical protein V6D33_12380 [Cyanophyceae cyanobacterium]
MNTAIERFSNGNKQLLTNSIEFFGVYISGQYDKFFLTEAEAQAYCENPENDHEFNGQILASRYSRFAPGEVFSVEGEESVYLTNDQSRYIDPIGGKWQMPFVNWQEQLQG